MLSFAAISPHPPIILPEIGKQDVVRAEKTINGMLRLSLAFMKSKPDIVIVISPHAVLLHDRIAISYSNKIEGNLENFGYPQIAQTYEGNTAIVDEILKSSYTHKIPMEAYKGVSLDHGAMVPLYYLSKAYSRFQLILSSISDFSVKKHIAYGKALNEAIKATDKRVAVIISGDLSHRLKEDGPYGFHPQGPEFDATIVRLLQQYDREKITTLSSSLVDEAGECGYRGICTLMGILHDIECKPEVYSYEGPWGVGYVVANMGVEGYQKNTSS